MVKSSTDLLVETFIKAEQEATAAAELRVAQLTIERDSARAIARVLAHCYENDVAPPAHMITEALEFPKIPG